MKKETLPTENASLAYEKPIGTEQLLEFLRILQTYQSGKAATDRRIISSENWWKLRNSAEESGETDIVKNGFASRSGWLHNVIVSKHADAMDAYPEPRILPREEDDGAEAEMLSAIIPCVLEQNRFEETYDEAMWRKMKGGTAVYKVFWDREKLNGLGDISVECVNLLNLFWEPGLSDIQKSRYFFHTELCDKDVLCERYPELLGNGVKSDGFMTARFLYDDCVGTENKATVVEVYYHKNVEGKNTLQYVKFVGDTVLFATENETEAQTDALGRTRPPLSVTGLYDHGLYPYVFDSLFPIEGSPCGYGYVDICRNPQTEIDMLKTCFVRNARVGSVPRYFSRGDGTINEEEFLDLENPIVHSVGGIDENALRLIAHQSLDRTYLDLLKWDVNELRETSGNTETASGNLSNGVTAAAAIAALQEASGKGSRDSTLSSYRAYARLIELCIELIRQFYQLPRAFRILGQSGVQKFISYANGGLRPVSQSLDFDQEIGLRLPVFDVKIVARKKDSYSRVAQNELAMQLFEKGFFDPENSKQALACLALMSFDGKESIMQAVAENAKNIERNSTKTASAPLASPDTAEAAKMRAENAPRPRE